MDLRESLLCIDLCLMYLTMSYVFAYVLDVYLFLVDLRESLLCIVVFLMYFRMSCVFAYA